MKAITPRPLKIKAWNMQTKLMMRLDSVDCVKGELRKRDHVLLQFTGFCDAEGAELYDNDVFLIGSQKHLICWVDNGWYYKSMEAEEGVFPLSSAIAGSGKRLCNCYEVSIEP